MSRKNLVFLQEAIILALIARPIRSASFKEIAKFIVKRNLFPKRKGNIPLETQIMLRTTKSKGAYQHLFVDEGNGIIRLKDSGVDFPLQLYNGLEALLEADRQFFNPDAKELSLIERHEDNSKEVRNHNISPVDVICIFSVEKSWKKEFFIRERSATGEYKISHYFFSDQEYNFKKLCQYLDPLSHYLIQMSKGTIVNVAYYEIVKRNVLQTNLTKDKRKPYFQVEASSKEEESPQMMNFRKVQEAYTRRILLQKATVAYKKELGL